MTFAFIVIHNILPFELSFSNTVSLACIIRNYGMLVVHVFLCIAYTFCVVHSHTADDAERLHEHFRNSSRNTDIRPIFNQSQPVQVRILYIMNCWCFCLIYFQLIRPLAIKSCTTTIYINKCLDLQQKTVAEML